MRSVTVLAGFGVAFAVATPLTSTGSATSFGDLVPRSDDPLNDVDQWCHNGKFDTIDNAYEHWKTVGGSYYINDFDLNINLQNDPTITCRFEILIVLDFDKTLALYNAPTLFL